MLARVTINTARVLDVHFESSPRSDEDGSTLVVDLQSLYALLPPIPDAWRPVTAAYNAVAPICTSLQRVISEDIENMASLLLDLELRHSEDWKNALPVGLLEASPRSQGVGMLVHGSEPAHLPSPFERSGRKKRRLSDSPSPIVIPSVHPSAPAIIITLAAPQPRETSCRTPCQDQAFGRRLAVPFHPVFNKTHPPMAFESSSLPRLDNWKWVNGHWMAVLPSLEEQAKRGMFSRPITAKRRKCRTPSKGPTFTDP
ncbi:unnamed protein product [Cyclocybe aegerita]|uniref:Uncharacterized protein n=1 Tax=Cyclocybe aegerita TaxID=1973307 RepID=A0A8S0XJW4_CYCAE|nr:unnamed protein product [Cyclocybe aegerita]